MSACTSLFGVGCSRVMLRFSARSSASPCFPRYCSRSAVHAARRCNHPPASMSSWRASVSTVSGCAVVGDGAAFAEHDNAVHVAAPDAHGVLRRAGSRRWLPRRYRMLSRTSCTPEGRGWRWVRRDQRRRVHRRDARQAEALFLPAGQRTAGVVEGRWVEPLLRWGFLTRLQISSRGTRQVSGPKATSLPTVTLTMEDSGSCCIIPAVPRAVLPAGAAH